MREIGSILEGLHSYRVEEASDYSVFDNDELFKRKSSKGTVVKDTYYCDVDDALYTADEWKKAGGKVKGKKLYIPKGLKVEVYRFSGQTAVKWKNIDIDWYEEDTPAETTLFVESAEITNEGKNKPLDGEKFRDTFKAANGQIYNIKFDGNAEVVISSIHPYDDTKYHYAKSLNAGKTFDIILDSERVRKDYKTRSYLFDEEDGFSTFTWQEIANELEDMNKKANLTSRMIHDGE